MTFQRNHNNCTHGAYIILSQRTLVHLPVIFEVPVLEEVEALGLEDTGGGRMGLEI